MVLTLLGQGPSMKDCPFEGETWSSLTVLGKKGWEDSPVSKVFCFDKPEHKAGVKEKNLGTIRVNVW